MEKWKKILCWLEKLCALSRAEAARGHCLAGGQGDQSCSHCHLPGLTQSRLSCEDSSQAAPRGPISLILQDSCLPLLIVQAGQHHWDRLCVLSHLCAQGKFLLGLEMWVE